MGALSFSTPLILLALAALPAIWLLLRATPPSPQQVRFPAFILLRRLANIEETPDKTPWWLLLLRTLIAALIILGLAGPMLNAPEPTRGDGPIILLVDNSWAAAPGWKFRRDAMASAAEEAVRSNREIYLATTADIGDGDFSPLTGEATREAVAAISPMPVLPDLDAARAKLESIDGKFANAEIRWLSDGLTHAGEKEFLSALQRLGDLTVFVDPQNYSLALYPPETSGNYQAAVIGDGEWSGDLVASAGDGRELARTAVTLDRNAGKVSVSLDLPLALQNRVAQVRLDGVSSAGAVQLVDARSHRSLIGIVASSDDGKDPLLSGAYYIRKALQPFAEFNTDTLSALVGSEASVIVLDDIGALRPDDVDALNQWISGGGVVIRFAGDRLAESAQQSDPPLLPVRLRGGGRAFGGALTWETPQPLGVFSPDSPFGDIVPPTDVFVRRQVLAEPGGETTLRTWASLGDGTPLVTAERIGDGVLVMFHITATPEWSDLPLSSVFIEMLRKVVTLSAFGPKRSENGEDARLSAYKILDGFGVIKPPPADALGLSLSEIEQGPSIDRLPGLYGAPESPVALNAVNPGDEFTTLAVDGIATRPYAGKQPLRLAPPLLLLAALLFMADGVVALRLAGKLRLALVIFTAFVASPIDRAGAQPLDAPIEETSIEAALATRLAYVRTGDPSVDRISAAGLAALSRELTRRTAVEPARPMGIDPETDDLSVFQFLYWPLAAAAAPPSPVALANIENFMRFGGLVVFDTRDDERAVPGVETPERQALQAILHNVDMPPLTPAPRDHVLMRSFYLLEDLTGRMSLNPVWVQAGAGPNDSVTPVIIGGRDWAGAWASDELGRPLLPMAQGGERAREYAMRTGVNMVMVALTGNYKSDQVHTPILLERLGHE